MSRVFTLEEAQAMLPELRAMMLRARDAALRAGLLEQEMAELSQRIFLSGGMHVDVPAAARRRAEREKALAEARAGIAEIEDTGARVAESSDGALEFPSLLGGREVLLCVSVDEDEIGYFREDVEGSERQPLDQDRPSRDRPN